MTTEQMPVHVVRIASGVYRHKGYQIEHTHGRLDGGWVLTSQNGRNWLGTFRTLRDARVWIAEEEARLEDLLVRREARARRVEDPSS